MVWSELLFAKLKRIDSAVLFASAVAQNLGVSCRCYRAFLPGRHRHRRHVMDTRPLEDRPLFAVVGCTGTGKTKLGVTLAKELDGEVVSADSIQVYKGLDVATNKATEEETEGIPHHMMGTLEWDDECNVHQYKNRALQIIGDIYSRGKVPILVGGTSYYIESIIYDKILVSSGIATDVRGHAQPESEDAVDTVDDLSPKSFREYAAFRHANDRPTVATVEGACRMYADALVEAVRFARTMPAVQRLTADRYKNSFVRDGDDDDDRKQWPSSAAECETAALYAHGVRVLDAVTEASPATDVRDYRVLAADVSAGLRRRYSESDVLSRLDALLADSDERLKPAFEETMRRAYAELECRTQRLALALLTERERTATELMSPHALKAHATYYDQASAVELHPHNTRKVFRTIQIYLVQGKRKSELFKEQRTRVTGSDVPVMALRFKEVHMMWLTCDDDVLNARLDKRTDEMVDRGLVDELCRFRTVRLAEKTGKNERWSDLDFTKGVLQCIGVKQFQRYLELPAESRGTDEGRAYLAEALTAMKDVTKNYARRQRRWINNRFLRPKDKQAVSVYRLDCTDLAGWSTLSDQAVELAQVVLGRRPRTELTLKPMATADENVAVTPVYGDYYCDDCDRLFSNDVQYNAHMASKKHVKVMNKRKRKLQDSNNEERKHLPFKKS